MVPVLTVGDSHNFFCLVQTVPILVDPDLPEQNPTCGSLMVLKAKNLPGLENSKFAKKEYDGFFILFEVDQRWYNRDEHSEHYTLTMRSNSELLLKCPAWSYDLLFERDELEGNMVLQGFSSRFQHRLRPSLF